MAFNDKNTVSSWKVKPSGIGISRNAITGLRYIFNEYKTPIQYDQNKNYQFVTNVTGGSTRPMYIRYSNPFKSGEPIITKSDSFYTLDLPITLYTYNKPLNDYSTKDVIQYGAYDESFASPDWAILNSSVTEIEFLVNGIREFSYVGRSANDTAQPNGWCYHQSTGNDEIVVNGISSKVTGYSWYFSPNAIAASYSTYGTGVDLINTKNYIAKVVNYDVFNLNFKYTKIGTDASDTLNLYLVGESNLKDSTRWGTPFSSITSSSASVNFKNLKATNVNGTKNYLVMSVTYGSYDLVANISDIHIYGGYHEVNNTTIISTNDYVNIAVPNTVENDYVYKFELIERGTTYSINSKIGNGMFKAGIWENGVWNNGYRVDDSVKDFEDIFSSVIYSSNVSWKIKINGNKESCDPFQIGDSVSIGNIVAIDINEDRKLIIDYYKISDKGSTIVNNTEIFWVEVNLDTTFPYRRIEKDSPNHKIKITKNIWKSGAFFNGRFSGVWNTGLFKGYPKLTEMYDTHWINGFFEGGHFNSNYPVVNFYNIKRAETEDCSVGNIELDFTERHGFLLGDYVIIDKDLYKNKLINGSYNGITKVVKVIDAFSIIVNKIFQQTIVDEGVIIAETGRVTRYTATSVIQNFKFYDTNRSKLKSNETALSSSVFSYNSWIDTNYDSNRAVTLARDFRTYEPLTGKTINRTNLYGYPSYDVLSSASRFRNSFNLEYGLYKLGTKYKVYSDFIGDGSGFDEPFSPENITPFFDIGWTFSTVSNDDIILKRTESIVSKNDEEAIKFRDSGVTGNELYISATGSGLIINNANVNIEKSRYSVAEFDVITYSVTGFNYIYDNTSAYIIKEISATTSFSEISISDTELYSKKELIEPTTPLVDGDLVIDDIVVTVSSFGSVAGLTLNLKAPNGNIVNLKKNNVGYGARLKETKFSLKENFTKFSDITTPYNLNNTFAYSDTYQMDKEIGQGTGVWLSTVTTLDDLVTDIYGDWFLYVKWNSGVTDLSKWKISIKYKEPVIINSEPTSNFPVINLSNLNYEVSTYQSDFSSVNVYKRMSYLPISENINHLKSVNTFRLDSFEKTSPERFNGFGSNQKTKKYEYFYNKTDLMLDVTGNGATGSRPSMVVLDNIKLYEVDMIPFFKYFNDVNIYKGIQVPLEGIAPEIDYLDSDFIFIDNVTLGIDTIGSYLVDNVTPVCEAPPVIDVSAFVTLVTHESESAVYTIDNTTGSYISISYNTGGEMSITGDIRVSKVGVCWSIFTNPIVDVNNIIILNNNSDNVINGSFTAKINNLEFETTYHVRSFAIDTENKTWYGNDISFTTDRMTPDYSALDYSGTDYNI